MCDPGFLQAQADNLPKIDSFMLTKFLCENSDFVGAEIRGLKIAR